MASDAELKIILTTVDRFSKNLDAISAKLTTTSRASQKTATGVQALNNRMIAFTRNARNMVGGLVAIAVATQGMRRAISSTIGLAIDFEDSFAGIRKTMDLTADEFDRLAKANRELAKVLPINVNEINRLGELAGQFGVRGVDNIVEFEEVIAGLGIATNLTADEAAIAMARIAAVTKTPISQIDNLASVVVELGNNFETTEREILDFTTRLAGTATALGFTASQIFGIAAAFTAVGVPAERGGTAVQKILIAMQEAATGATEELDAFTTVLGLTDREFKNLATNDPSELLIRFIEALAAAGDQAIPILQALNLADQRLLATALSAAGGVDTLRRAVELANIAEQENTALTEEVDKKLATTNSKLQIAANNWADLGLTIGQQALPAIRAGADASIVLSDALTRLGEVSAIAQAASFSLAALLISTFNPALATSIRATIDWGKAFEQLPGPIQNATIAVAASVDTMVNAVVTGLNATLAAIDEFTRRINQISPFKDIPPIGQIGIRSNIVGGLRGVLAPGPGLTLQEQLEQFRRRFAELVAARDILPDFTFGEVPAAAETASKASKAAKEALTLADALADGIIELSEAIELGLSIKDSALLELAAGEVEQAAAAFRANVEFEKLRRVLGPLGLLGQIDVFAFAMTDLGQEFRRAGESIAQFVNRLAEAAQDALRTAFSDLFARPTREQAELESALAQLRRQRALLFSGGRTADELEPLLTPLDAKIAALENALAIRREEQTLARLSFDLADQTLLTDQQQLVELRFIRAALEEFTGSLTARNTSAAVAQIASARAGGGGRTAGTLVIEAHMSGIGMSIEEIGAELSRKAQDELRRSGFGGSLIGSGTFVPS